MPSSVISLSNSMRKETEGKADIPIRNLINGLHLWQQEDDRDECWSPLRMFCSSEDAETPEDIPSDTKLTIII
jgi:hypothetical protein